MNATLLSIGLFCVIAAIIGGGLEALGAKMPVLNSLKRQLLLGFFGLVPLSVVVVNEGVKWPFHIPPSPATEDTKTSPTDNESNGGDVTAGSPAIYGPDIT
jgi:hypothetical protein